jgi:hypothetical protein
MLRRIFFGRRETRMKGEAVAHKSAQASPEQTAAEPGEKKTGKEV